jgi:sugar phosphate isomerase/epimerase
MKMRNEKIGRRLGYQALFDAEDIDDALVYAKDNGFGAVELNLNGLNFLPENYLGEDRRRVRKMAEKMGVQMLLHAPEGLNLLNVQDGVRMAVVERLKEVVDYARDLSAACVTFHLGFSSAISVEGKMLPLYKAYPELYKEVVTSALLELSEYAKGKTNLCLENTEITTSRLVREILVGLLGQGGLCLTWDIGHSHQYNMRVRQWEEEFFLYYKNKIKNTHIHDNNGKWDEHNVLGKGTLDLGHYLPILLDLNSYMVFEVRPRERALESLRKFTECLEACSPVGPE